ncbi:hypothetical protein B0H14DRAFT_1420076 [Mycena olivaceomarginata]|nr:hypothetical protein B0H14DRAFT_1420076 [Mycena olivaceomarginata]
MLKQTLRTRGDRTTEQMVRFDGAIPLLAQEHQYEPQYWQCIVEREATAGALREQMSSLKQEYACSLKAGRSEALATLAQRVDDLKHEWQVHVLQQGSADKEVKIAQVTKQRVEGKQESKSAPRHVGVPGTRRATPAQPLASRSRIGSRPLSDAGAEPESAGGVSPSSRPSTARHTTRAPASMGPPATKPRASLASTGSSKPVSSFLTKPRGSLATTGPSKPASSSAIRAPGSMAAPAIKPRVSLANKSSSKPASSSTTQAPTSMGGLVTKPRTSLASIDSSRPMGVSVTKPRASRATTGSSKAVPSSATRAPRSMAAPVTKPRASLPRTAGAL